MASIVDHYQDATIQTNVFKKYTSDHFNHLKHIEESCEIELEETVNLIGDLLLKHNLADLVGVSRVHNHFQLGENELVYARVVQNGATLPNLAANQSIVSLKAIDIGQLNAKPIPYMWAYDKRDKKLFAVQFFDASCQQVDSLFRQLIERAESLRHFFNEFIKIVEQREMEDNIGIYIFHHQYLSDAKCTMEITDEAKREQWIYPEESENLHDIKLNENVTTTMWDFSCPRNVWCSNHCRIHCRNHCRSHCRRH